MKRQCNKEMIREYVQVFVLKGLDKKTGPEGRQSSVLQIGMPQAVDDSVQLQPWTDHFIDSIN